MNHFASAVILFLAMYAQAASADRSSFLVLNQKQNLAQTEVKSIKPAWSIAKIEQGSRLVGFANINRIQNLTTQEISSNQSIGLGLYQQHTPWLHSQLLVQQHPLTPNRVQSLMEWMVDF